MPLTDTEYEQVIDLAGSDFVRVDADKMYDRVGTINETALTYLRRQLVDMAVRPMQWAASGAYTESWFANRQALKEQIRHVEDLIIADGGDIDRSQGFTTAKLTRTNRERLFTT